MIHVGGLRERGAHTFGQQLHNLELPRPTWLTNLDPVPHPYLLTRLDRITIASHMPALAGLR